MFLLILAIVAVACMGRRFSGRRRFGAWGDYDWRRPPARSRDEEPAESVRERFEAWHRAKHAHQHRGGDPGDTEYV